MNSPASCGIRFANLRLGRGVNAKRKVTMRFSTLLKNPAKWITGEDHDTIVLTSRVRLARNLAGKKFPGWTQAGDREEIVRELLGPVLKSPDFERGFMGMMDKLKPLQKQLLVERHLISPELASRSDGCGVVISRDQELSVMLNEEDHMRMQSMRAGLNLAQAWEALDRLDSRLEAELSYAYDSEWGYLTACPTNVGTGMRASVMLHLPGLVAVDQMARVMEGVSRLGFVVRGIYGEGTEFTGNLFQISNQYTLSRSEQEIIEQLTRVVGDIREYEKEARKKAYRENFWGISDSIGRAWGTLRHAMILSSQEALSLLSIALMASDLGLFGAGNSRQVFARLMLDIQPAHLQWESAQEECSPEQRDILRAWIVRQALEQISSPTDTINESPKA